MKLLLASPPPPSSRIKNPIDKTEHFKCGGVVFSTGHLADELVLKTGRTTGKQEANDIIFIKVEMSATTCLMSIT